MKLIVLIVAAVLSVGTAAPVDTLRDLIISIRDRMPCGIPEYNLPVLAPFILETFGFDTSAGSLGLSLKADDLRVDGLNSFEIDTFTFNHLLFRSTFEFTFEQIKLHTKYDLDAKIAGLAEIFGNGVVDLAIDKLNLKGNLALRFFEDGSCALGDFKIALDIGKVDSKITGLLGNEAVSGFLNDVLVQVIMDFVKENPTFVSAQLESLIIPLANGLLVNLTVKDILEWLGGGGGSSEPPAEPCVPPTKTRPAFLYGIK